MNRPAQPSAGILWSKVSVDPFETSSTAGLATSPGIGTPGTVSINNLYSTPGRVSLRVGTSLNAAGLFLQPFVTISGFREFVGHNSATISTQPDPNFQLSGIGNYGPIRPWRRGHIPNTGWAAYVCGDYRTGEKIDGWSMNGGLRYQLNPDHPVITGRSADIPVAPIAVAAYNWTGFYLGPSLGADWGYTNWTLPIVSDWVRRSLSP